MTDVYKCGHCGYCGTYAAADFTGKGFSAPWCPQCGMNNKFIKESLPADGAIYSPSKQGDVPTREDGRPEAGGDMPETVTVSRLS